MELQEPMKTVTRRSHTTERNSMTAPAKPGTQSYTLLAARDGEQWASLCRELDIASCGTTAEEALDMVELAVAEALAFERETGVKAGEPVPDAELETFVEEGRRAGGVVTRTVTL